MIRIRPVKPGDHKEVLGLARLAGIAMSSLPQDAEVLKKKIAYAADSFAGKPPRPREENFLFVMEDMEAKRIVGTTALTAHVGLTRPFYSYKLSTLTQAATEIGVYSLQQVLHMVNDYTDATVIGSLFLHPDYRRDGLGKFLSRSRCLMLAEFPKLFSEVVISEIRGVQDSDGHSPFYDNLARHFFKMEFREADYIYATQGTQFIADLMPKYPIYVNLLSPAAQGVIGQPFETSRPAMELLQAEGFRHQGYVDLFDAGPTVEAERSRIRTVRKSVGTKVSGIGEVVSEKHLICNARLKDFTIVQGSVERQQDGSVAISAEVAKALGVKKGDEVRYAL